MTPDGFARAVRDILDAVPVMTLATAGDGLPWATDVYFAAHHWNLVFFSSPSSRHGRNLATQPACSVTVHPPVSSWRDIRGVQMEGIAHAAGALGATAETASYLARFPFVRELLAQPGAMAAKMAKVSAHVFVPTCIRYIDNSQGFGSRFLVPFADGEPAGPPALEPNGSDTPRRSPS